MVARSIAVASIALGVLAAFPAIAKVDAAAVERAIFRTLTLKHSTAPRETIAAASKCGATAAQAFPAQSQEKIVEIDRRPVYTYNDRLTEIVEVVFALDDKVVQPFVKCFDSVGTGAFGPLTGSIPATSAPNPTKAAACPIYADQVRENELTCYCQPLLGGIAYGHKTYSDTSSICLASRHAGATDYLTGGVVKVAFRPGCSRYDSVTAYGYPSGSTGKTARSFHFPSIGQGPCPN